MALNNIILTTRTYSKLVLYDFGRRLNVARNMTRSIDSEFAKAAYKVGDNVGVRKPYRFSGGEGIGWDPEPLVDQVTQITVGSVPHVHFQWDAIGKTLDLREAMKIYTTPTAIAMASKVNAGAATWGAHNALNSQGTPGTAPTGPLTYLSAGDMLIEQGLPDNEELVLVVNRRQSSAYVNGTLTQFNPADKISRQYDKGEMQKALGYNLLLDQTINTHINGVYGGSPVVNGANQSGANGNNATMTLNTNGWSSGATTLNLGDKFVIGSASSATVGGVNSVHPQTRNSTGRQQVFTVMQQISDTTGAINMVVAPAITPATLGAPGNQYANVDSSPVANAIITIIGASGATSQQALLYHENAFAFVTVPIHEPKAGMGVDVEQFKDDETGLTISHLAYYDGDNGIEKHKFQALVGYGNLYAEMACVIQS